MEQDRELALLDDVRYREQLGHMKDQHRAEMARLRAEHKRKYQKSSYELSVAQGELRAARMVLINVLRGNKHVWMGGELGWRILDSPMTYKRIGVALGLSRARVSQLHDRAIRARALKLKPL